MRHTQSVIRRYAQQDPPAVERLVDLMGLMHALRLLHYSLHWGSTDYDEHLLFQRLYGCEGDVDISEEIDTLAEKIVADFGAEAVKATLIHHHMGAYLQRWDTGGSSLERALAAEKDFQTGLKATYEALKAKGALSLGMDDFLMATANSHETHVYLLQQYL